MNMRFKWRSHLAVTALAAFSLLPFAGCSSQQQGADEQVEASQGGQGEQGESSEQAQAQGGQEASGQEEATAEEGSQGAAGGDEVVTNNTSGQNTAPAEGGDLQEIINEMGSNGAPAETAAAPAATEEAAPAEAAPAAETAATAPAEPASAQGLPELGSKMPYIVEKGDTLGTIATKIYGDQKRWHDINSLSGLTNPNRIFPGDVVYFALDQSSAQFAANYEGIKRGKETVREGDTLASIASRVYGTTKAWRHLWRQNDNIDNPDKLTVGMTIYYVEKDFIKTSKINSKTTVKTALHKTFKTQHAKLVSKTFKANAAMGRLI
jgi:nucleoid-associated protein YgaU